MGNKGFHDDILQHLQLAITHVVWRAISDRLIVIFLVIFVIGIAVFQLTGCASQNSAAGSARRNRSNRGLNNSKSALHWTQAVVDSGADDFGPEASMLKMRASDLAMRCATEAVQLYGGYGYIADNRVERLMRDAKITQIYEGTSEVQKIVISRSILGA